MVSNKKYTHAEAESKAWREFPEYHEIGAFEVME